MVVRRGEEKNMVSSRSTRSRRLLLLLRLGLRTPATLPTSPLTSWRAHGDTEDAGLT